MRFVRSLWYLNLIDLAFHNNNVKGDKPSPLVDEVWEDFTLYIIVMKAKSIAFFEYHNDRTNLTEDSYQHHLEVVA